MCSTHLSGQAARNRRSFRTLWASNPLLTLILFLTLFSWRVTAAPGLRAATLCTELPAGAASCRPGPGVQGVAASFGPGAGLVAGVDDDRHPIVVVSLGGNWFWTSGFNPGALEAALYESAAEGSQPLWQVSAVANASGFVHVYLEELEYELRPGRYLVVSDTTTVKQLLLEMIVIEHYDAANEIMSGYAPAGRTVKVVGGLAEPETQGTVEANADLVHGFWVADFSAIGYDLTDAIRPSSFAQIVDEDGHAGG